MQPFPVRSERRRKRIEGDLLTTVAPDRIAGNFRQHLEAVHELHDPARFEALPRIVVARAAILIPGKSAPGELAVEAHHRCRNCVRRHCRNFFRLPARNKPPGARNPWAIFTLCQLITSLLQRPCSRESSWPGPAATARRCGCKASGPIRCCRPSESWANNRCEICGGCSFNHLKYFVMNGITRSSSRCIRKRTGAH